MAQSQVRQNFHVECEAALNKQINVELHASYVYMSMVCMKFKTMLPCRGVQSRPFPWAYEAFPLFQKNMLQKSETNKFSKLFVRQNFLWLF